MRETHLTLPELFLVASTRAALGAGLGLVLSDFLDDRPRRILGWSLLADQALSTIPIARRMFAKLEDTMEPILVELETVDVVATIPAMPAPFELAVSP